MKTKLTLLIATLSFGIFSCQKEVTQEVLQAPKGSFTYTTNSLSTTCTSTSTGEIISLTWEFGDGASNTDQNNTEVTHTYASAGTYAITLTAANGAGHGVDVKNVTVK